MTTVTETAAVEDRTAASEDRAPAPLAVPVAVCLAVAVVSLVLPATLAFDPWAWLVWGREILHLDLDTTGGPSWKPLPVLAATVVSATGDHAPTLWLVGARAAGLLAVVFAFRLAARYAGIGAGAVAAVLLLLTPDGGPRFLRLVVEGHAAPVSVTLGLWAVERHLDGRRGHALVLGTAVALMRPEAWPFLGLYAAWLWRREPAERPVVAVALAAVPLLWFGGDWWGSGDPWHGADAAQVVSGSAADRFGLAAERALTVVVPPAWLGAGAAVVTARRRGDWVLPVLAGAALAWLGLVTVMSIVLGYAALSRFYLAAAGVLCVLAGVGAARVVAALSRGRARVALAAALVVASLPAVLPRVAALGTLADGIRTRAELESELDVALDQTGRAAVLACGEVAIDHSEVPRMALAWKLGIPLGQVGGRLPEDSGVALARPGGRLDGRLSGKPPPEVVMLGRSDEWVVYAVSCPDPAS